MLFVIMFLLLLTPVVLQTYMSGRQADAYREIIDNITYANQLNTDVSEEIGQIAWNIVAGKVGFDESGIMSLVAGIRERMYDIRRGARSVESRGVMEVSLRALNTLEIYLERLNENLNRRARVEENEILLEEIRICVAGINDLLLEYSSKQVTEAAVLNEEMSRQSTINFAINILLAIIVIIVGVFSFLYISRSILDPIEKLLLMSDKISAGDFSVRMELEASDEFNILATGMNTMAEEIELLIQNSIEEQKQVQKMEHKVLQAQITPHFLYNTLDAIIWATEANDMKSVLTLVTSLSSFFRISLSDGIDFIPLSDEIAHVRSYLTIQQVRYSDVLSYEIDVDEGLGGHHILKLLLQPLVENSLYHGIKNTRERGKITVSAKRNGDKIRFSVADNGLGMTAGRVEELKREINQGGGEKGGYGLFNVNRRLKLYYGLDDGIEIVSEYKKGTTVSFSLEVDNV
ncbi:MAG: sensor histidine kinase [Oscillospiraceae bacterium]|nr:sensor histidine kinase [Oscillospiraceae bacterium]